MTLYRPGEIRYYEQESASDENPLKKYREKLFVRENTRMKLNLTGDSGQFPSRRELVYACRGMVCTSQPLAAQAGLDAMKAGGNAVDAAVAAASAMTVCEPTSNGLGSDAFAIVWIEKEQKLYGLNASGVSPMALSYETVRAAGEEMPRRGWMPVMVPGAPAAWQALTSRLGRRTLSENLEGAAVLAEEGYPVEVTCSHDWALSYRVFDGVREKENPAWLTPWFDCFAPKGRAPQAGEIWKSEDMARTLREIGSTQSESYYRGSLAEKIDSFSRETGGYLRKSDLEDYAVRWVSPLSVSYRGYDVWELPPNGDGMIALMTLNILRHFELSDKFSEDGDIHRRIEALKKAFADGQAYISDPAAMRVAPEDLLAEAYGKARAGEITDTAQLPSHGNPSGSGTIYLCTADGEGNMVSYIQSNYMGFGSGVVVPGTGISLQNRGCGFTLDPNSPNCYAPGKKAFHTIIPGFLTRDGKPVGPFGVMGGFMQPQGHVQVLSNLIDLHFNPQEALDAPRWQWTGGNKILLEPEYPKALAEKLSARGHEIEYAENSGTFGRGEIIFRHDDGVLTGAVEKRAAGYCAAW